MKRKETANRDYAIKAFILDYVSEHTDDIVEHTADYFGLSPATINKHIKNLLEEQLISIQDKTSYILGPIREHTKHYALDDTLDVASVWTEDFLPLLSVADNDIQKTCRYAIEAIINNTIQYSQGQNVYVYLRHTPDDILMIIRDDGQGLLQQLQQQHKLNQAALCFLELAKGAFSGQDNAGNSLSICARSFSDFAIDSGNDTFTYQPNSMFVPLPDDGRGEGSTIIRLLLSNQDKSKLTQVTQQVADKHCHIPVHLVQIQNKNALSLSQAKYVLARAEQFSSIELDFQGVNTLTPAFANEIFFSFAEAHPNITLTYINANDRVEKHIQRTLAKAKQGNSVKSTDA